MYDHIIMELDVLPHGVQLAAILEGSGEPGGIGATSGPAVQVETLNPKP
jgi:hypothetical protein